MGIKRMGPRWAFQVAISRPARMESKVTLAITFTQISLSHIFVILCTLNIFPVVVKPLTFRLI